MPRPRCVEGSAIRRGFVTASPACTLGVASVVGMSCEVRPASLRLRRRCRAHPSLEPGAHCSKGCLCGRRQNMRVCRECANWQCHKSNWEHHDSRSCGWPRRASLAIRYFYVSLGNTGNASRCLSSMDVGFWPRNGSPWPKPCLRGQQPENKKSALSRRFTDGETRTRTGDTTIFSRVLYQLSYLAATADGTGNRLGFAAPLSRCHRRPTCAPGRPPPRPGAARSGGSCPSASWAARRRTRPAGDTRTPTGACGRAP